jgi:hypothetical protein
MGSLRPHIESEGSPEHGVDFVANDAILYRSDGMAVGHDIASEFEHPRRVSHRSDGGQMARKGATPTSF